MLPLLASLALVASSTGALELSELRLPAAFEHPELLEANEGGPWGQCRLRAYSVERPGRVFWRVVEVTPKGAPKLSGFLGRWRAQHGCTAAMVKGLPTLVPGQLAFGGSCEGGDRYLTVVFAIRAHGYELHVDTLVFQVADLAAEMRRLMSHIQIR
ncbi:MAG: hypothetical protein U1E65_35485 [Myxococcota bacterium]